MLFFHRETAMVSIRNSNIYHNGHRKLLNCAIYVMVLINTNQICLQLQQHRLFPKPHVNSLCYFVVYLNSMLNNLLGAFSYQIIQFCSYTRGVNLKTDSPTYVLLQEHIISYCSMVRYAHFFIARPILNTC